MQGKKYMYKADVKEIFPDNESRRKSIE